MTIEISAHACYYLFPELILRETGRGRVLLKSAIIVSLQVFPSKAGKERKGLVEGDRRERKLAAYLQGSQTNKCSDGRT